MGVSHWRQIRVLLTSLGYEFNKFFIILAYPVLDKSLYFVADSSSRELVHAVKPNHAKVTRFAFLNF
jgi:hypothetical protein